MDNTTKQMTILNMKKELNINNNKIITDGDSDKDSTFNKLLELQLLIKKESGLKELCK